MAFLEKYISFFKGLINKLIPKEKRKIVLVCITGGLVLLIIIMALLLTGSGKESFEGPEGLNKKFAIPPGEIFLPDEPDFLPGVLLEREQRAVWTEQDAVPFWQDPLKNGEEEWREKIETMIDNYLERVP